MLGCRRGRVVRGAGCCHRKLLCGHERLDNGRQVAGDGAGTLHADQLDVAVSGVELDGEVVLVSGEVVEHHLLLLVVLGDGQRRRVHVQLHAHGVALEDLEHRAAGGATAIQLAVEGTQHVVAAGLVAGVGLPSLATPEAHALGRGLLHHLHLVRNAAGRNGVGQDHQPCASGLRQHVLHLHRAMRRRVIQSDAWDGQPSTLDGHRRRSGVVLRHHDGNGRDGLAKAQRRQRHELALQHLQRVRGGRRQALARHPHPHAKP